MFSLCPLGNLTHRPAAREQSNWPPAYAASRQVGPTSQCSAWPWKMNNSTKKSREQSEGEKKICEENEFDFDDSGFADAYEKVRVCYRFLALIYSGRKSQKCNFARPICPFLYSVTCDNQKYCLGYQWHQWAWAAPSWRSDWDSAWHHSVPQSAAKDPHPASRAHGSSRNNWGCRIPIWGSQSHHRGWIYPDDAQVANHLI